MIMEKNLEEIEHFKGMLEEPDTKDFLERLINDVAWGKVYWRSENPPNRLVFIYGELERSCRKYEILDDLILLIEETFETNVGNLWCDFLKTGENCVDSLLKNPPTNSFFLFFGGSRKIVLSSREDDKKISMTLKDGDSLYLSSNISSTFEVSIPPQKKSRPSVIITFNIDSPYSRRERHRRNLNVLGVGNIPIFFQGRECEFPEDAVAVVLPNTFLQMIGGVQEPLYEESLPLDISFEYS